MVDRGLYNAHQYFNNSTEYPICSYLSVKFEAAILNTELETDNAKIPRHAEAELVLDSLQNLVG